MHQLTPQVRCSLVAIIRSDAVAQQGSTGELPEAASPARSNLLKTHGRQLGAATFRIYTVAAFASAFSAVPWWSQQRGTLAAVYLRRVL